VPPLMACSSLRLARSNWTTTMQLAMGRASLLFIASV
jgi:hypothetical protein